MKALVVFDSTFGNTKQIADAIARHLAQGTRCVSVTHFKESDLAGIGLLVVGSPIIGWNPSERMKRFLETLRPGQLAGIKGAAFDTRVKMFFSGDAAKKISNALRKAGADIVAEPHGFFVRGKEGPLFDEELAAAAYWAQEIRSKV
jgi:flavodoxin